MRSGRLPRGAPVSVVNFHYCGHVITQDSRAPEPTIPFNELGRGLRVLRTEIDAAIARVLDSGWFVMGPEHDSLQRELAQYLGVAECVALGNGTDALELAMRAVGVGAGDLVVTVANAGGYTSTAVRAAGAQPHYADVDESTLQMTVATLDRALATAARRPAAIVVTHLFGAVGAELPGIIARAEEQGVPVIEDCAQSMGAMLGGRRAGSFGLLATTSFYPTKNLGALGDGGAVVTGDADIAERVRRLRQYGWESKYRAETLGGRNSRLDEMQAAVLRVRLPHLDAGNERRRRIHDSYAAAGGRDRLVNSSSEAYVGHLAVLDCDDRETSRERLHAAGIRTDVHYPVPDHLQSVGSGSAGLLPVTERSAGRILSLPLFPELTDDEVARVSAVLADA